MKVINYSQQNIDVPLSIRLKAEELEHSVKNTLIKKYCRNDEEYYQKAAPALARQFPYVLWALQGNINGKRLLDLGCGSISSPDTPLDDYEPWLCRLLWELGVAVIGVDINEKVKKEMFPYKVIDLFQPSLLSFLKNNSIDLVHAASLVDSPSLRAKYGVDAGTKLLGILSCRVQRILKPGGVFLIA